MYEIWKLHKLLFRAKVLTKFNCDLWPVDPKCIGIVQSQSVDKVQLWPLTFWPQMYRYLPLAILYQCMKYESCMLKTTQVIMSEPKCWPSSLVTLTFDPKMHRYLPLTILHLCFLSPSYIYVWNMKDVRWKLLQLSCQNQSVDKVPLWH